MAARFGIKPICLFGNQSKATFFTFFKRVRNIIFFDDTHFWLLQYKPDLAYRPILVQLGKIHSRIERILKIEPHSVKQYL